MPPPRTAILIVSPSEAGKFCYSAFRDGENWPLSKAIDQPWVDRAPDVTELDYLDAVSDALHKFALANPENLTGWIENTLEHCGNECCLVVLDNADTGIPWELMKLPVD